MFYHASFFRYIQKHNTSTDQAIPAEEGDLSPGEPRRWPLRQRATGHGASPAVVKKSRMTGVQIMKENNTSRVNVNTQNIVIISNIYIDDMRWWYVRMQIHIAYKHAYIIVYTTNTCRMCIYIYM